VPRMPNLFGEEKRFWRDLKIQNFGVYKDKRELN
jgi:hypothetical protein